MFMCCVVRVMCAGACAEKCNVVRVRSRLSAGTLSYTAALVCRASLALNLCDQISVDEDAGKVRKNTLW